MALLDEIKVDPRDKKLLFTFYDNLALHKVVSGTAVLGAGKKDSAW